MKNLKNNLIIILFSSLIFIVCASFFIVPDKDVSATERRPLAIKPEFTAKAVFSGEYFAELETYLLDQFPMRESYRTLNAWVRTRLMRQSDVNGLWIENGSIFKQNEPLNEKQIGYGTTLMNKVKDTYFKQNNVYYSVIPDKNYFIDFAYRPKFDYDGLKEILNRDLTDMKYIDIMEVLDIEDYYKTDTHWSQDKIFEVVEKLGTEMGVKEFLTPKEEYQMHSMAPFYGVYWGQAALTATPDILNYMTSEYTENASVYGIDPGILKSHFGVESTLSDKVYDQEKFYGIDGYDIYLSGAQPVVIMECDNAKTDKELIIFRDSFGSSISPLFTGAYKKITLIDLRYIPSSFLGEYVDMSPEADVLFLYSTDMLNSSMLMK